MSTWKPCFAINHYNYNLDIFRTSLVEDANDYAMDLDDLDHLVMQQQKVSTVSKYLI